MTIDHGMVNDLCMLEIVQTPGEHTRNALSSRVHAAVRMEMTGDLQMAALRRQRSAANLV